MVIKTKTVTVCDLCAAEGYPYDEDVCRNCEYCTHETHESEAATMKTDWKRKLTSRKFWAAIVGVAISLMMLCGVESGEQERIVAVITSTATLIAYIAGESAVDKEHKDDE